MCTTLIGYELILGSYSPYRYLAYLYMCANTQNQEYLTHKIFPKVVIIITHRLLIRKLTSPKGLNALVCGAEKYKR